MSDGDYLYDIKALIGPYTTRVYKLLDGKTGAGAGAWVRAQGAIAGKVTVSGLGTGGVTLYSHTRENPDTDPTDSDDHEAVGSEITSNGFRVWWTTCSHSISLRRGIRGRVSPSIRIGL